MKDRSCFRVSGLRQHSTAVTFSGSVTIPAADTGCPTSDSKNAHFFSSSFSPYSLSCGEHRIQSLELFSDSGGEDEDIIQVAEQDTEHFLTESCLHESLEGGRCSSNAIRLCL